MYKWCFSIALGCSVLLTGCEQTPQQHADQQILQQDDVTALETRPIKAFPQTADDQTDLARLSDFDFRFYETSEAMEKELEELQKAGKLTEDFAHQRRLDNVQSALNMLKALELKTEQGRYIQGLFVTYWEQQSKLLSAQEPVTTPRQTLQDLGLYMHAQEQLDHWQAQYSHQDDEESTTSAATTSTSP